ncbi:hypothetical protein AHiyo6_05740 [Arthrobacter sp. Hiyo6]|nr:hypothetical protein AHiyo6_05740 [Arthrobacter sp. Hiyo6]
MSDARLLSAAELAARLSVSTATVYEMCKKHQWPHAKIGRLYRFTEDHYKSIIVTPEAPRVKPRTQRENVARLLASSSWPIED